MKINRANFLKSVRFSPSILIQDNVMFFMKIGKEEELLVKDLYLNELKVLRNKFIFVTKELRTDLEVFEEKFLDFDIKDGFLYINNLKIELIDTVVKYGKK